MTTWTAWCESRSVMDRIPGSSWRDAIRISMTGGGVYCTVQWEVDPDTGSLGNSLENKSRFDAAGNLVKSLEAGSQLFTKTTYDSLQPEPDCSLNQTALMKKPDSLNEKMKKPDSLNENTSVG